jgi:hypothetical protein
MKINRTLVFISFFLLFCSFLGKIDPKSKKPSNLSDELFCVGCVSFAIETVKLLKGKNAESDVFKAISDVCKGEYSTYCNLYLIKILILKKFHMLVIHLLTCMMIIILKSSLEKGKMTKILTESYAMKKQR